MKRSTIYISMALVLSVGLLLTLLWLLGGEVGIFSIFTARAAEPAGIAGSGDVYCVTLVGGGPYSGCDQVFTSVQVAVDAASGGEVIKVAAGNYTGVQARPAPAGYDGPSVITQVVYISKSVTIQGGYTTTDWIASYPITQPTTLDAQGQGRGLFIAGDITSTVEGLCITGGDAAGLEGAGRDAGGGLYLYETDVTLRGNIVFDNIAELGGGLYLWESDAALNGNTVSGNTARWGGMFGSGGGLYLSNSDATISGNTIVSNTANGGGGGLFLADSAAMLSDNMIIYNRDDGVFLAGSDAILKGNVISGNTAGNGGGLNLYNSDATISNNIISSNTVYQHGGGLYLDGGAVVLSNNAVISNTAGNGGGLYMSSGSATLINNIVANNQANTVGSGLYLTFGASSHLLHNTITRNIGGDGSGVHVDGNYTTVALTNTILVSHTVGITVEAGSGASLEGTLWGSGAWANGTDWGGAGTIITGTVNIWGDPDFVDPDNGDYHIGPDSAAIDAGVDAGIITDIDGEPRPIGLPDIGMDEYVRCRIYLPLVLRNY